MVVVRVLTRPLPAAVLSGGSGSILRFGNFSRTVSELVLGSLESSMFFVGWLRVFGIKLVFVTVDVRAPALCFC